MSLSPAAASLPPSLLFSGSHCFPSRFSRWNLEKRRKKGGRVVVVAASNRCKRTDRHRRQPTEERMDGRRPTMYTVSPPSFPLFLFFSPASAVTAPPPSCVLPPLTSSSSFLDLEEGRSDRKRGKGSKNYQFFYCSRCGTAKHYWKTVLRCSSIYDVF